MFLGIHATMMTISENVYGLKSLQATKLFLRNFMDGETEDTAQRRAVHKAHRKAKKARAAEQSGS